MNIELLLGSYLIIVLVMTTICLIFFGSYDILKDVLKISRAKYFLFFISFLVLIPILLMALISLIFGIDALLYLGEMVI